MVEDGCVAGVTIQKLAKLAGVSLATVSRSLNTPHLVSPATLAKVQQVIRENDYVYKAMGRTLPKRRGSVIGVIIPSPSISVFASTLIGIQEVAFHKGYSLMVANTNYDAATEYHQLRQMQEQRVAGIIIAGYDMLNETLVLDIMKNGTPVMVMWDKVTHIPVNYVAIDNFRGAYASTDHCLRLGHTRIGALICVFSCNSRTRERLEGYQAALADHGIEYDPSLVISKKPTLVAGKEAAMRFLAMDSTPSAIICGGDHLAIGAMSVLSAAGKSVPDDISICGFDDVEMASYCQPSLTTIRVPCPEIGRLSMELLLEVIEQNDGQLRRCTLDTDLVIRRSCSRYTHKEGSQMV